MDKPIKPSELLPESFGGIKEPFSADRITNGYEKDVQDIFSGGNLNDLIDKTGKNFAYTNKIADFVSNLPINNIITTDENNKLIYIEKNKLGGSSLPLFTAMAFDHILSGDEAIGLALAGSLVTMTYPQAVENVVNTYNAGTETTYRGIACKVLHPDGRFIASIAQKSAIDALYTSSGVADFYVLDSVNERFYLPRSDWFVQGTGDPNKVNQFVEAGVANISGKLGNNTPGDLGFCGELQANEQIGALSTYGLTGRTTYQGTGSYQYATGIEFDASKSNPIYGKSSTVQPPSSLKLVYYKVGNTVVNEELVDVGQVLSDLQMKADLDLGNITQGGRGVISANSSPSGAYIFDIWAKGTIIPFNNVSTTQGGAFLKYTCPANGFFTLSFETLVANQGYVALAINNNQITKSGVGTTLGGITVGISTIPVKAGAEVRAMTIWSVGAPTAKVTGSYFEYAQGEI